MKTSELTGVALDWAVTKAEGFDSEVTSSDWGMWGWATDWAQGGEIIEREKIRLDTSWREEDGHWAARIDGVGGWWGGDTPLVAAMRCYVASQLGDEVDVPEELL